LPGISKEPFELECPECRKEITVTFQDALDNKLVKCPRCGQEIKFAPDPKLKKDLKHLDDILKNLKFCPDLRDHYVGDADPLLVFHSAANVPVRLREIRPAVVVEVAAYSETLLGLVKSLFERPPCTLLLRQSSGQIAQEPARELFSYASRAGS